MRYRQGLQEEIKYLEYELKLLKDKEILEREGVNELDNFLKDEIPINENILAMKNKYNATKAKLEQQLSSLTLKKHEAEEVLNTQKGEIDRLHQIIQAHRKQTDERREDFRDKLAQYAYPHSESSRRLRWPRTSTLRWVRTTAGCMSGSSE